MDEFHCTCGFFSSRRERIRESMSAGCRSSWRKNRICYFSSYRYQWVHILSCNWSGKWWSIICPTCPSAVELKYFQWSFEHHLEIISPLANGKVWQFNIDLPDRQKNLKTGQIVPPSTNTIIFVFSPRKWYTDSVRYLLSLATHRRRAVESTA